MSAKMRLLLGSVRPRRRSSRLHVNRDNDLLHRLADLDQLRGAGLGMRLQLAPFRPVVSLVVVVDVAEQEAASLL